MKKSDLMSHVGKEICIYFKDSRESAIHGTLGYVNEFSSKYDYRKPNYFYIGNTSFKASHVKAIIREI